MHFLRSYLEVVTLKPSFKSRKRLGEEGRKWTKLQRIENEQEAKLSEECKAEGQQDRECWGLHRLVYRRGATQSHYEGAIKTSAFRSVWLAALCSVDKAGQGGGQEEVLQKPEQGLRGDRCEALEVPSARLH